MDVRARRYDDLDELVTIAARVHAADGYPIGRAPDYGTYFAPGKDGGSA